MEASCTCGKKRALTFFGDVDPSKLPSASQAGRETKKATQWYFACSCGRIVITTVLEFKEG